MSTPCPSAARAAPAAAAAAGDGQERAAQRLFVRVADQRSGMDCEGAQQQPEGAPSSSTAVKATPGRQAAGTSCSYASAASAPAAAAAAPRTAGPAASACPVSPASRDALNPATLLPRSLSEPPSSSAAAAASSLSPQRQASTIPMAATDAPPKHQEEADGKGVWMYPSEQMFFSAMKRKGWDPRQEDMPSVVAIHNSVNERAWREVMMWESLHAGECAAPRLKKFQGKPSEYSPKARLLNTVGFALPFDRHDWVVDRCGKEVRYVIDFYSGPSRPGAPVAMFIDARPALDSFEAAWDRARLQFSWLISGRWI